MIKLFLTDMDGCLTDGCNIVSEVDGRRSKQFNTKDFFGLRKLHESGVEVGVLTNDNSSALDHQIERVGRYIKCFKHVKDKLEFVHQEYVMPGTYGWDEIAYIGDEELDIPLLKKVGWAACPRDAVSRVIEVVSGMPDGIVLELDGGRGCVREFAELVLFHENNNL